MTDLKILKALYLKTLADDLNLNTEKIIKIVHEYYQIPVEELMKLLAEVNNGSQQQQHDQQTQHEQDSVSSSELNPLSTSTTAALSSSLMINEHKCYGKTKFGIQCSRSKSDNSVFCGSHLIKLPYGRCDMIDDHTFDKPMKKRGRPKK